MKTESKKLRTISHNGSTPAPAVEGAESGKFDWNGAIGNVTDMISNIWGKKDTAVVTAPVASAEPSKNDVLLYVGAGALVILFLIVLLKK